MNRRFLGNERRIFVFFFHDERKSNTKVTQQAYEKRTTTETGSTFFSRETHSSYTRNHRSTHTLIHFHTNPSHIHTHGSGRRITSKRNNRTRQKTRKTEEKRVTTRTESKYFLPPFDHNDKQKPIIINTFVHRRLLLLHPTTKVDTQVAPTIQLHTSSHIHTTDTRRSCSLVFAVRSREVERRKHVYRFFITLLLTSFVRAFLFPNFFCPVVRLLSPPPPPRPRVQWIHTTTFLCLSPESLSQTTT